MGHSYGKNRRLGKTNLCPILYRASYSKKPEPDNIHITYTVFPHTVVDSDKEREMRRFIVYKGSLPFTLITDPFGKVTKEVNGEIKPVEGSYVIPNSREVIIDFRNVPIYQEVPLFPRQP